MSLHKLSGKDFDVTVGDMQVKVETATLKITDNRKVRYTNGVADGFLDGDTSAEGEMVVNHSNFLIIQAEAQRAGSWKGIDPIDIAYSATVVDGEKRIEAYGCLLMLEDIADIKAAGGESDMTKIPFMVTSPDFVRINGVPYLRPDELEGIV